MHFFLGLLGQCCPLNYAFLIVYEDLGAGINIMQLRLMGTYKTKKYLL
jgi:hypothetical protein